jgi:FKBP-type peptidyl-prolyl cis-trans isomerase
MNRAPLPALLLILACAALPAAAGPPTEVQVVEQVAGDGTEIRRSWFAIIHYQGWLYDEQAADHKGRSFIDSRARGQPVTFVYGYYRILEGLEKGMRGMKVGGKRTIVVPAKLGYDGHKYPLPGDVPPNSALVFDVELLDAVPQSNTN